MQKNSRKIKPRQKIYQHFRIVNDSEGQIAKTKRPYIRVACKHCEANGGPKKTWQGRPRNLRRHLLHCRFFPNKNDPILRKDLFAFTSAGEMGDGVKAENIRDEKYLFISGTSEKIGKSFVSLGIISTLLKQNILSSEEIAYMKLGREDSDLTEVIRFLHKERIQEIVLDGVGLRDIFVKDISGSFALSQSKLLKSLEDKMKYVANGKDLGFEKKLIIIEGFSTSASGSSIGMSNATVANSLQANVILVNKGGDDSNLDNLELHRTFFEAKGCNVVGCVLNRLELSTGVKREEVQAAANQYLSVFSPHLNLYGVIPESNAKKFEESKFNLSQLANMFEHVFELDLFVANFLTKSEPRDIKMSSFADMMDQNLDEPHPDVGEIVQPQVPNLDTITLPNIVPANVPEAKETEKEKEISTEINL
eukprot:augustus_masked-scaffold_9-processed-gene-10.61-mRNA-1 protein AED:1.00 eAED:1.00 QI:0/-1/0/0/-1/1/1/0/420